MRKTLIVVLVILAFSTAVFFGYNKYIKRNIKPDDSEIVSSIVIDSLLCKYKNGLNYQKYDQKGDLWQPNNKFGLYVYAENADFIELAQNLVNSNGGTWGYVLIPYNTSDRDEEKWNRVFKQLGEKKLIPVIQLWDIKYDDYKDETENASKFLNQFAWPIKYRYIAAYNEPNSADFWYGRVAPDEYAKVLDYTIKTFKNTNSNFYIMNAGFNASAPNNDKHMDSFEYMKAMDKEVPGIFEKLDAWASHSYPQPNFSGNPHNKGRWSIEAYDVELDFLHEILHVKKDLPVFITETGWAHAEGEEYDSSFLSVEQVGEFLKQAYNDIWLPDKRVRAVMPFTVWYPKPFDHFAWVNQDKVPYNHYNVVKSMKKVKGSPPLLKSSSVMLNVCDVQE